MTVPKLRFPEFRDAGEWEEKKLGDICDVRDGTHDSPQFYNTGKPLVTSKNLLSSGLLDLENVSYISQEDYEKINKRSNVDIGDILFGMIGTIGNPVMVKLQGFAIKNVALIKQKTDLLNCYLVQFLNSRYIATRFNALNTGNTQKFIALGQIRNLSFPVPTLPEQQTIADCLASLDDRLAAETQTIDTLKAHKKGLMQQLFPAEGETLPKLRFPEFRDAGEWEEKTLKSICSMQAGRFVSASNIFQKGKGGIYPCYGGNGLRGYTKTSTHSGRYSLIGRQGALCGNVNLANGDFYATEHAVVVTPKDDIDVNWLFYKLDFINLNRYATGQAQPGLSVEVLEKIQCIVPTKEKEQQTIADCLGSLDETIAAQAETIALLKVHKKGLMQQLFPAVEEAKR